MVKVAKVVALVSGAGYALAGVVQKSPDLLPSRRDVLKAREEGLRLVKTSDEDPGVWVTEDEKFEQFISKKIGFADITDTLVRSALYPQYFNDGKLCEKFCGPD